MGGPGPLSGLMWVVLDRSQGLCGRSWAVLVPLLAVLGHLGSALGCYVGGLGPLLGSMLAVLGLMLAVLGRMLAVLAALEASVGGPETSCAEKKSKNMTTLKMCLFLERERDLRPGGRS